jgi:sec-independent protein translocase protein TatA
VRVGFTELLVILAIVLLMFGSKKLPELADGMGKAIRNFKRGIQSEDEEDVTHSAAAPSVATPSVTSTDKQVAPRSGAATVAEPTRPASEVERKS